jgi:hypothetical protein
MLGAIRQAYRCHLKGQRTEASLVATATYFVTLIAVRGYTTLIHPGPDGDIAIGGTHIHHVVFGIVALLVAGFWLSMRSIDYRARCSSGWVRRWCSMSSPSSSS